jgi:hypothetical protein
MTRPAIASAWAQQLYFPHCLRAFRMVPVSEAHS